MAWAAAASAMRQECSIYYSSQELYYFHGFINNGKTVECIISAAQCRLR